MSWWEEDDVSFQLTLCVYVCDIHSSFQERLLVILELLYAVEVRHQANGMGRAELAIIAGPLIAADVDLPCYFVHLVSNARILLYYAHFMLTSRLAKWNIDWLVVRTKKKITKPNQVVHGVMNGRNACVCVKKDQSINQFSPLVFNQVIRHMFK